VVKSIEPVDASEFGGAFRSVHYAVSVHDSSQSIHTIVL
jgi:hypothetical protein